MRRRSGPSIGYLLASLLADGLDYRCHPVESYRWRAICPRCRKWTLRIAVENDDWLDDHSYVETGTVVLGCVERCATPNQLRQYLGRRHVVIAYERMLRDLRDELRQTRSIRAY